MVLGAVVVLLLLLQRLLLLLRLKLLLLKLLLQMLLLPRRPLLPKIAAYNPLSRSELKMLLDCKIYSSSKAVITIIIHNVLFIVSDSILNTVICCLCKYMYNPSTW